MAPDIWSSDDEFSASLLWLEDTGQSQSGRCELLILPDGYSLHVRSADDIEAVASLIHCDTIILDDSLGLQEQVRCCLYFKNLHLPVIALLADCPQQEANIEALYEAGVDELVLVFQPKVFIRTVERMVKQQRNIASLNYVKQVQRQAQRLIRMAHWQYDLGRRRFRIFNGDLFGISDVDNSAVDEGRLSRFLSELFHQDDRERLRENFNQVVILGRESCESYRWCNPNGQWRLIELQLCRSQDDEHGMVQVSGVCIDITERREAQREMARHAYFDPLTGLANRLLIERSLDVMIPLQHRSGGSLAFFYLDIDHFSRLNNVLGHSCGDTLLVELAQRLRSALQLRDVVSGELLDEIAGGDPSGLLDNGRLLARLAADSFGVLVCLDGEGAAQRDSIAELAAEILTLVERPFYFRGQPLTLTASLGISFSSAELDGRGLMRYADLALHEAKTAGRRRLSYYLPDMMPRLSQQLAFQTELASALSNGELQLYYQPLLSIDGSRLRGAEALLRWKNPRLGDVSPAAFIPLAEESGQIIEIGHWVFSQACEQLRRWHGTELQGCVLSLNISTKQLRDPSFVDFCVGAAAKAGVPTSQLELEITEGVLIADESAADCVRLLHEQGFRIALDDFGTGYCSLSYLLRFPLNTLKIDRSFVHNIAEAPEKAAVVSAVTELSLRLGLDVVAEGVERLADWQQLQQLGCHQVQGYYFARPMSARDLSAWLASRQLVDA